MEDIRWPKKIFQWTPQEEMRKIATIMEEPSEVLHEKKKHGRRYGGRLAFGSGWTAFGCIDPIYIYYIIINNKNIIVIRIFIIIINIIITS